MQNYIFNLETTKIELHFNKEDYLALPDDQKRELKSAYLFSRKGSCWVSRAKEPNLWNAKRVAKKLGFVGEERSGERVSYAEQLEVRNEKKLAKADRYEHYASNASKRAEALQQPIKRMRGDNSFFTQPVIVGHAGSEAFAKRRQAMFDKYHKGFQEYVKSDELKEKAAQLRQDATNSRLTNRGYNVNRFKECKKEINARERNIIKYEQLLHEIEQGNNPKKYNGSPYEADELISAIENETELIVVAMEKQAFHEDCLDQLGGFRFSKGNIHVGDIVELEGKCKAEVLSTGPQNIKYKIIEGGAQGFVLRAPYAEIIEVVERRQEKENIDVKKDKPSLESPHSPQKKTTPKLKR